MQFRTAFYAHSILLMHISPNLDLQGRKRNPCFGESDSQKKQTTQLASFIREQQVSSLQSCAWLEEMVLPALTTEAIGRLSLVPSGAGSCLQSEVMCQASH